MFFLIELPYVHIDTHINTDIRGELIIPEELEEQNQIQKEKQIINLLKSDLYYKDTLTDTYQDTAICAGKDGNYLGIGIVIQPGSELIISAPPQYPGYKAGLREGDRLIDPFSSSVGADGYINFTVRKNKELVKYRIKAENICFKKLGS